MGVLTKILGGGVKALRKILQGVAILGFNFYCIFVNKFFFKIYVYTPPSPPPPVCIFVFFYTFSQNLFKLMSVSALSTSQKKKRRDRSLNGTSSKVQFDHFCGKYLLD